MTFPRAGILRVDLNALMALDAMRALRASHISDAHRRGTNYERQQGIERALAIPNADQARAALRVRLTAATMMIAASSAW